MSAPAIRRVAARPTARLMPIRAPMPPAVEGPWPAWLRGAERLADEPGPTWLAPAAVVARVGRPPPPSLTAELAARAARFEELAPTTWFEGLSAALCGRHPDYALQWLLSAGLLAVGLPELAATVDLQQEAGRRHKDVWEHTKTVVWQAVPRLAVRWGAALHDIGKVPTRRFVGRKVTFHGHAEVGARMFRRGPARRIAFPPELRERIEQLILWHLRPGQYDPSWTESALRRFGREVGPALTDLLDLSRADTTTKYAHKRKANLAAISELSRKVRALLAADAAPKPLPPGLGNLLMAELGWPPGPHVGELRDRLAALYEAGELAGGQPAEYYLEAARTRGLLDGIEVREPGRRKRAGPRQ